MEIKGIGILDDWQKEVLSYEGNICLRAGRQVGKSTIISVKAALAAVQNKNHSVMIISATERQAHLLFQKVLMYLDDHYKSYIKKGKDRPTKTTIRLNNGSVIRSLPTGMDGLGIRGYTINLLIADEAAFINASVWQAVIPMLTTTGGHCILLSTPYGCNDHFYNKYFHDDTYKTWHISAEEVAKGRPEPMRSNMLRDQEQQKKQMTKKEYAQEYLGEFVDDLLQFFPDELIKKCMTLKKSESRPCGKGNPIYIGVDVARMGGDESTFEVFERTSKKHMVQHEHIITKYTYLTDTSNKILSLDKRFNFHKIYVDDAGLGIAVYDYLRENPQTKKKIVGINNRTRAADYEPDKDHRKKLLKEDLYNNLKGMLERGEIELFDDDEIFLSFKSIQLEYDMRPEAKTRIKIFGTYSHIVEGIIRAAWGIKEKYQTLWIQAY